MKSEGKPIPHDWDGESYSFYMLCGPDSILWNGYIKGAIFELTRGRGWDINTGNIKETQEIAWEIYNSMAKCDDLIKVQRMLVAAIVGEAVDLTDEVNLIPDAVDYTDTGPSPGLSPQLNTLHNRFVMADSSVFNPLNGEKNIVEALETQLRVDSILDLEFLTPNIATVLNQVAKIDSSSPLVSLFNDIYEWLTGSEAPDVEYNTVADLLLLIASQLQQQSQGGGGWGEIAESLGELENIRKALEVSIDDGQGGIKTQDLASVANRVAVTLDRIRDNLDVISDDGKEFGLAAIAHYYSAESIERIDRIRDNLDAYIVSEDKEFGIAALLDGLNRLSFTATEYLRCIAESMNDICPPNVDPPALSYIEMEPTTTEQPQEDDWIAELEKIRAEAIANDPDEGRDELKDDTPDFDDGSWVDYQGVLLSVSVDYIPDTPGVFPYLIVEIETSGPMDVDVITTSGYHKLHHITGDEAEFPFFYRFEIKSWSMTDIATSGTVWVVDLWNDNDTLYAQWGLP